MKYIKIIVSSQVNTLVQANNWESKQHPKELRAECQTLANQTNKPVRLLTEEQTEEFRPENRRNN